MTVSRSSLTMYPIHPVKPLNHRHPVTPCSPEAVHFSGASHDEHTIIGTIAQIETDRDPALTEIFDYFRLERHHSAHAGHPGDDAHTGRRAIFTYGCGTLGVHFSKNHRHRFCVLNRRYPHSRCPTRRAGTPAQISPGSVDSSSTAFAPTIVPFPMRK